MEVWADLMPEEFCDYHPKKRYNREGSKRKCLGQFRTLNYQLIIVDLYEAFNWNYEASNDPDFLDASILANDMWPEDASGLKIALCAY